jgi:hypothetical protein
MLYCDRCAEKGEYQKTDIRKEGTCQLCNIRVGKMNVFPQDQYAEMTKVEDETRHEIGGFQIQQKEGFVKGTRIPLIESVPHKVVGNGVVAFFDSNKLILARMETGQRIEIKL